MKLRYRLFAIFAMLTLLASTVTWAQNNPYKIQDNLYEIWDKSLTVQDEHQRLAMVQEMYDLGMKQKDYKAVVMSGVSATTYYARQYNQQKLDEWVEKVQQLAMKYDYMQYYFHVYSQQANMLMNSGSLERAIKVINQMTDDALKYNSDYGLGIAYGSTAGLYFKHMMFDEAFVYYKKSIPYLQKSNQQISTALVNMAICYSNAKDWENAGACVLQAINEAKVERNKGNHYARLLYIYCYDWVDNPRPEMMEKIEQTYQLLSQHQQKFGNMGLSIVYAALSDYYTVTGQREKAMQAVSKSTGLDSLNSLCLMAIVDKDLDRYRELVNRKNRKNLAESQVLTRALTVVRGAELGNDVLERENHELELTNKNLELSNANLTLSNANLTLKQENESALLHQSQLENKNLELQNRNIKLASEEAEAKASLEKVRLEQEKVAQGRRFILVVMGLLAVIVCLLIFYILFRNRLIRQLHRKNEQLSLAKEEAEKANNLKTMFVQNMSHEIRTPLNAICGFSEVLANPEIAAMMSDDERSEYGRIITANTQMLLDIVNDILDLGKIQNGKYKMVYADCKPSNICSEALSMVKIRVPDGVELKTDYRLPEGLVISSDGNRIKQVVTNFLTNACKNTSTGSITLSAYPVDEQMIAFGVTDTGIGVAPENAARLFQRFEKLDSFKQGTGLGLTICRAIADGLHGRVYYDPSYTSGARFVFELPKAAPDQGETI